MPNIINIIDIKVHFVNFSFNTKNDNKGTKM